MMVRYILNTNQQLIGLHLMRLTILIKATKDLVFVIDGNEYRLDIMVTCIFRKERLV